METQAAHSSITGTPKLRPRYDGRTPLQPKNSQAQANPSLTKTEPKQDWIEISVIGDDSNKENYPIQADSTPTKLEPLDLSLADELSAIKKKLERLRLDKDKTEKMLKERDMVLEMKLKELQQRGQIQKCLEIEVDRLFRLRELKDRCMRVSPIRTLREKEQGRVVNESPSKVKTEDMAESGEAVECELPSPGSASSSSSPKADITEKKVMNLSSVFQIN